MYICLTSFYNARKRVVCLSYVNALFDINYVLVNVIVMADIAR